MEVAYPRPHLPSEQTVSFLSAPDKRPTSTTPLAWFMTGSTWFSICVLMAGMARLTKAEVVPYGGAIYVVLLCFGFFQLPRVNAGGKLLFVLVSLPPAVLLYMWWAS